MTAGNVPLDDMRRTFNMGVGMIMVVDPKDVDAALKEVRRVPRQRTRRRQCNEPRTALCSSPAVVAPALQRSLHACVCPASA